MYLETMSKVLPRLDKQVILDGNAPGVVPYLPLQPGATPRNPNAAPQNPAQR
jgi:hypothetical protein